MESKLDDILRNMATKADVASLSQKHDAQMAEISKKLDQCALKEDVNTLRAEVGQLPRRVQELEASRAGSRVPGFNDPAYRRISLLGFPEGASAEDRIEAVEEFFKEHFPRVRIHSIDNYYKGSFKDQSRKLSRATYAEFSSGDVRDQVLATVSARALSFSFSGSAISCKKGLTRDAMTRNWALKDAAKILPGDSRCKGKDVKTHYGADRHITVAGVRAFVQDASTLGAFAAPFDNLSLPTK